MAEEVKNYYVNGGIFQDVDTMQYPHALLLNAEQIDALIAGTLYPQEIRQQVDGKDTVVGYELIPVTPYTPTLDEAKAQKAAEIEAAYLAELADGITVTVDDDTYQLAAGESDQTLFNRDLSLLYAQDKSGTVDLAEHIVFIDFHDTPKTVTKARYFAILAQYGAIIRSLFVQRATMLMYTRLATSLEAVASISIQFTETL